MLKHLITLRAAGVPVTTGEVLGMWLRRSLTRDVVATLVIAHKTGIEFPREQVEMVELAGGSPEAVVSAAIVIERSGLAPDLKKLIAVHLAKRDVRAIAEAFVTARRAYPELSQAEFLLRSVGSQEDIVAQVRDGSFRPRQPQA